MRCTMIGAATALAFASAATIAVAQQGPGERDRGPDRGPAGKSQREPGMTPGRPEGPGASERRGDQPRAMERPDRDRPRAMERPDRDRPRAMERPDRDRPKATERPDRDQPRAKERPDRDRPKATERPDRDQPRATERPDRDRPKATERPDRDRPRATERPDRDRPKATERPDRDQPRATERPDGDRPGRVQVSEKQRSDVRARLRQTRIDKTRINIDVNVGRTIPRSVRLRPLPVAIFALAPAYRGYSYVVLEDETIVVVDARTYVIVDVIPTETRVVEGRRLGPLVLSTEQMRFIYEAVPKNRTANVRVRLALGAEVPRSVDLLRFPADVVERVPEVRPYRFIVTDNDEVVIVDPTDNAVALVITE
jgi:hypothetical protein